jgi:hypothetical protein
MGQPLPWTNRATALESDCRLRVRILPWWSRSEKSGTTSEGCNGEIDSAADQAETGFAKNPRVEIAANNEIEYKGLKPKFLNILTKIIMRIRAKYI